MPLEVPLRAHFARRILPDRKSQHITGLGREARLLTAGGQRAAWAPPGSAGPASGVLCALCG